MRIKLPDTSSWPRPSLDSDENNGPAWKARYAPSELSRADLMELAAIADAYAHMVIETTQKRRDYVCREIRRAVGVDR